MGRNNLLWLVAASLTLLLGVSVFAVGVLTDFWRIDSVGVTDIKGVGLVVYADAGASEVLEVIDWGVLWVGGSKSVDVWCLLDGNVPSFLSLNVSDWLPVEVEGYLILSWDYDGSILVPGELRHITLSLSALVGCPRVDFSFSIYVMSEEAT